MLYSYLSVRYDFLSLSHSNSSSFSNHVVMTPPPLTFTSALLPSNPSCPLFPDEVKESEFVCEYASFHLYELYVNVPPLLASS